jgi:hypothetical protein
MVPGKLDYLPYFLVQRHCHSIRLTLSSRHSAHIGRMYSQSLGDSTVESSKKRNEMRLSIFPLVAFHDGFTIAQGPSMLGRFQPSNPRCNNDLRSRFEGLGFHVSNYRLLQLRIYFVRYGDYVPEHLTKIQERRVFLERPKDGQLQDS